MQNVLTIDLEEWYHANYTDGLFDESCQYEERIVANTHRLLELFERYGAKATFFTLGSVAERYPGLLRHIRDNGHEIASHGYGHQLIYKQTEAEFEEDLQRSVYFIEQAIGQKPKGYRAPSWSVKKDTPWVFPVLQRNGFAYDASIFPVQTFLYGIPDAPRMPFHLDFSDGSMLEFPTSTMRIANKNVPFSGGFYFRFLPYALVRRFFHKMNRSEKPVIFYLHPREIDPQQPKLEHLNFRDSFIHYYQIESCLKKLERLLMEFSFTTVEQYLFHSDCQIEQRWHISTYPPAAAISFNGKSAISG